MTYGSAVASFWVEEFGCERAERLTRDEIDERYEAFRSMTSIESPKSASLPGIGSADAGRPA